ncbi:hypothetical protein ED312_18600 [Sinomicrobium pectinilyticum]|uniref:Aminotransferase n=1 Tax=Sinomicrobium pectinilyticum TaxID=1084421 RepID=A0A3N0E1C8_SINP1|nr:NTP transferase domain-containing protein [Sinomicrobium pectinilyticum]RNL81620.1 hypothetical protein ED312_18600 [Sinomicrobium pectinilyticum]
MSNLGIVIQARLGSSRLPNKVLLPLKNGKSMLMTIIERLEQLDLPIVVATTNSHTDLSLVDYLKENNIKYTRGDEMNVLSRFIKAGEENNFDFIIRVCSDNPYIDITYMNRLIQLWKENKSQDYISFSYKGKPTILSHFGIFGEIVSFSSLLKISKMFPQDISFQEHVTKGVYSNPSLFNIALTDIDKELEKFDGIRLTVDTLEDYHNICEINEKFSENPLANIKDIGNWILGKKKMIQIMNYTINKNLK